jgi:hypothetical protein
LSRVVWRDTAGTAPDFSVIQSLDLTLSVEIDFLFAVDGWFVL